MCSSDLISYELPHKHNNPPRLMEDLATAEISRSQLYQWWHLNTLILMENGSQKPIQSIFETILQSETDRIQANEQVVKYDLTPEIETLIKNNADQKQISKKKTACIEQFHTACKLFKQIVTQKTFTPFIPEMAYPKLVKKSKPS